MSNAPVGPVSLSLFKLSYCTTTSPRGNQLWTHLPNRSDMFAVFDTVRGRGIGGVVLEKKVLKLICGRDQLEVIELDNLRHQARIDADRCQSQLLPDDLRHVILIVKKPLLALRYQLPDGRIRRIQMNFRPASGCDTAFETLKATGIVVVYRDQPPHIAPPLELHAHSSQIAVANLQPRSPQEQQHRLVATTTNPDSLPPSAQPPQLRPNSSQAALASSQPRSQGYQRHIAYEDVPSSAQPPRVCSQEAAFTDGHLHTPLVISELAYSQPSPSQDVLSSSQPRSQGYKFIAYDTPSSRQPHRSQTLSSFFENGSHTDDFSKAVSYVRDPRSQDDGPGGSNNASHTGPLREQTSILSTDLGRNAQQPMLPPASRELLPSPSFGNESSAFGGYGARPASAPEIVSDSQLMDSLSISQMLPPQRVLPFPEKPPNRDTENTPACSEEASTTRKANTKVTKPKKGRASAKPKSSLIISLPSSSAPTRRSRKATAIESPSDKTPPSNAPRRKRTAAEKGVDIAPASSAPPKIGSTLEALERTVSKITEHLTPPCSRSGNERRPLSAVSESQANERQSQTSNLESSPTAQLPQPGQLPNLLPNIQPAEFLDGLDGWIRKYHGLPVPKAPMTAKEQLADYAAKPDAERAKIIDDMILECLHDENFGKLCDDVERNWKRICLGF